MAGPLTPNAQFDGVVVNAFSVAAKGMPQLTAPVWLLFAAGIAAGAVIGKALAERVPEGRARLMVLLLALAAACAGRRAHRPGQGAVGSVIR